MFKGTYRELRKRHAINMPEAEFNAHCEIMKMEAELDPKPKHIFGSGVRGRTAWVDDPDTGTVRAV